jgi:hypothetical protein
MFYKFNNKFTNKKNIQEDNTKHNLLNWKLKLASRYGRNTYLDGHKILQMVQICLLGVNNRPTI